MEYYLNLFSGRQFVDSNGAPYNGAKLFIYSAGSSTKVTTYKDNAGASSHANPIILNARGEPADGAGASQPIWQEAGVDVKLVLAPANDTDPPVSAISTWDNIGGINDASAVNDQWIVGPTPTFVSTTGFTLVGDQSTTFHVGRRVKTTNSGGTIYSTITAVAYTTLTTVTVVNDSGVLDSGISAVSYAVLSADGASAPSVKVSGLDWTHQGQVTMSGKSFWMAEGAAVASANDCNIWTTDGNTAHISGTTEIQDWGTAPQAGAWKWVIFDDALQLTYNATTNKTNTNGANYTTVAGDRALIYADDTGTFVVTIFPLDDKNFQALPLMPSFDSIGTTATQTYTSGTNPLTVPDDIYWMVFTGSAGGGGGGCTSGGTPSAPTNGGDTKVSINGVTVLTLTGGQGGLNNTTTGTRNGGTAKIKTAASVYGKTRQLVGYVRTFIGGLVDGNSVTDSAVGASSQFGTAGSNGAGGNGQSTNLAGAAGASCDLLFIPVRPGDSVSVVIGAAGVRGIGDNQGQDGGAGFMHIEY